MKNYLIAFLVFLMACTPKGKQCCSKGAKCDKDIKTDEVVVIKTTFGTIKVMLYEETKVHKENFLKLAKEGFYDSTTFHRVIDGFMIQGGDPNSKDTNPNNDGQGGPGYTLPAEIMSQFKHDKGALAAARLGGPVNPEKRSSGSQFYIVEPDQGTPQLNNDYTVFGKVIEGIEVVEIIALARKDRSNRPTMDIRMFMSVENVLQDSITAWTGYKYPTVKLDE